MSRRATDDVRQSVKAAMVEFITCIGEHDIGVDDQRLVEARGVAVQINEMGQPAAEFRLPFFGAADYYRPYSPQLNHAAVNTICGKMQAFW